MTDEAKIEPLLTAVEVAALLKCSPAHVVSLYHAGRLPAAGLAVTTPPTGRPGRRMLRFRVADVRAYIDAQTVVIDPATAEATTPRVVPAAAVGADSLLWGSRKKAKAKG